MKTTVELPDTLYRQAKAEAVLRGRKLKDLVEEGPASSSKRRPPQHGAQTSQGR